MNKIKQLLVFLLIPLLTSCATMAVSAVGGGIAYTVTNVAYKTFNYPLDQVSQATTLALKKMAMPIEGNSETERGRKIKACTEKRLKIVVELEPITSKCTKMKVTAKKGLIFKDKATATEIIYQTDKILEKRK